MACRHVGTCIWEKSEDWRGDIWDEIDASIMDTDCPVFMDAVRRREEKMEGEGWGVWVTGGIFDSITKVPFPGR